MAIPVECDYCGHRYRVQERFAGDELPCKNCGEYFFVPSPGSGRQGGRYPDDFERDSDSESMTQWPMVAAVVGAVLVCVGVLVWAITSRSSDRKVDTKQVAGSENSDGSESPTTGTQLFPLASVPVPNFPNQLPPASRHPSGARIHFVNLKHTPGNGSTPGSHMSMRIYMPAGNHAARSLGCVLVGPAGSTLLCGMPMDDNDYHDETLPYVNAGYVAVTFSIDGAMRDRDNATNLEFMRAYNKFKAAQAGVVNARNALEFVLAKLPEVDPGRIYSAGHSSAGVLSLLLAEHEPRINGCIAYAPASDVELRLSDAANDPEISTLLTGLKTFLKQSSPKTHSRHFECPVFLFHARDDSNEPIHTTEAFSRQLRSEGKNVVFRETPTGDHYDSMIEVGIPQAIAWLKRLPTESGKAYPQPDPDTTASNRPTRQPNIPTFQPPTFRPPSIPSRPPVGGVRRTMTFQLLAYSGTGDATEAAKRVLRRYPWCVADTVRVDLNSKQVVIEIRGGIINSGPVKSGLAQAGFQLGGVSIRSR